MSINPAHWSLKSKFISIALLVFFIPISSVILLKEIEKGLVDNLKQNLLLSAKLYSYQLTNAKDWFLESHLPESDTFISPELFVFPLQQDIVLDGFFEEWLVIEKFRTYYEKNKINSNSVKSVDNGSMGVLLGSAEKYLFLSINVVDDDVTYGSGLVDGKSDKVMIEYVDDHQNRQSIYLQPNAPGRIPVQKGFSSDTQVDWRFTAVWVETSQGYNLEIKFPFNLKPTQIKISSMDVDLNQQTLDSTTDSTSQITTSKIELNPMVWPSSKIDQYIRQISVVPGQRLWILDTKGRMLARTGNLQAKTHEISIADAIFNWVLTSPANDVDRRGDSLRLNSSIIKSAINLTPKSMVEMAASGDYSNAIAASPIVIEGELMGVVLIEENIARVQLLQQQTLSRMLYVMFGIIFIIMFLLTWYVSRLIQRISKLKRQVTSVVDNDGRMAAPPELSYEEGDEIAELSNAFYQMGNKLYEYNNYLEKLASRLSHELRTPIAVVRSSLDNLLLNDNSPSNTKIIERAMVGVDRLGEIINRMRQASGIKDAMQSAEKESLNLVAFVAQMVEGFKQSFTEQTFIFQCQQEVLIHEFSPDLLAELVDKLLGNAIDFSEKGKTITVGLIQDKHQTILSVKNFGAIVAKKNSKKIFDSLVSIRTDETKNSGNLGLGLYVVKLIAEFHQAKVSVENLPDEKGVVFSVIFSG